MRALESLDRGKEKNTNDSKESSNSFVKSFVEEHTKGSLNGIKLTTF